MQMQDVKSSNIKAIGYNPNTKKMYIQFHSGGTYEYSDVDLDDYINFKNAPSHGKELHSWGIKGIKVDAVPGADSTALNCPSCKEELTAREVVGSSTDYHCGACNKLWKISEGDGY